MQRKSSRGCIEEEPKVNNDLSKEKVFDFINLCWRIFKLALILVIIFPFVDKIRHKGYNTQAVNFFNEYDIGCKPCNSTCDLFLNKTKIDEPKSNGF